jgi:hypothetical protein
VADAAVIISGEMDGKSEKPSLIAEGFASIKPFEDNSGQNLFPQETGTITIEIPRNTSKQVLTALGKLLKSSPGDTPLPSKFPMEALLPKHDLTV